MQLFKIEDQSFHIYVNPKIQPTYLFGYKLKYVTECMDKNCPYTRSNTNIRFNYEKLVGKKILSINQMSARKNDISILFYGSWHLYQELCICLQNLNQISQVHLADFGYNQINLKKNESYMAIDEFARILKYHKNTIEIFVHTNPLTLYNSTYFRECFDIVCGIDIDYSLGIQNNRPIMKNIALNTLKKSGSMIVSQHSSNMIDISKYVVRSGKIKQISIKCYVKNNWNKIFMIINQKLKYGLYILALIAYCVIPFNNNKYFPLIDLAISTVCVFRSISTKIKTKIYSLVGKNL